MADLFVDMAALRRTQQDIDRLESLLRHPTSAMADLASSATDIEVLRHALQAFSAEWDDGISRIGRYTRGVADALGEIRSTFERLDHQLARDLDARTAR